MPRPLELADEEPERVRLVTISPAGEHTEVAIIEADEVLPERLTDYPL